MNFKNMVSGITDYFNLQRPADVAAPRAEQATGKPATLLGRLVDYFDLRPYPESVSTGRRVEQRIARYFDPK